LKINGKENITESKPNKETKKSDTNPRKTPRNVTQEKTQPAVPAAVSFSLPLPKSFRLKKRRTLFILPPGKGAKKKRKEPKKTISRIEPGKELVQTHELEDSGQPQSKELVLAG
jgi:hypothetical protein